MDDEAGPDPKSGGSIADLTDEERDMLRAFAERLRARAVRNQVARDALDRAADQLDRVADTPRALPGRVNPP